MWPLGPGEAAYQGLAGRIVETVDPFTEGDPAAVLGQLLVGFGAAVGTGPHAMVGATRHGVNENVLVVGDTAKARKGDSFGPVRRLFELIGSEWCRDRMLSGFGSGEALIWAVRDASERSQPIHEQGRVARYQSVTTDPGVQDKRLLVVEPEFARVLRVARRQSTLSVILRDAWDGGNLQGLTKGRNLRATGVHVAAIGHITADELRHELSDTDAINGFMNRWVVLAARRSKLLPDPAPFEGRLIEELAHELNDTIGWATAQGLITRSPEAREHWAELYGELSVAHPGLVGSMLARAEAHVLRLSLLYALLDESTQIRPEHQAAAYELWMYADRSVRYLFGSATGSPTADRILRGLEEQGELTRTQVRDLLGRHATEDAVRSALKLLRDAGLAVSEERPTGGRPVEVWRRA